MTDTELYGEFSRKCNNTYCDECKYKDVEHCHMIFAYEKAIADVKKTLTQDHVVNSICRDDCNDLKGLLDYYLDRLKGWEQ